MRTLTDIANACGTDKGSACSSALRNHKHMSITRELQSFFKAHPDVTIGQFATVADVYTTTIVRGLAGEKLWESSEERIRHAIDVYCNDDDMSGESSPAIP